MKMKIVVFDSGLGSLSIIKAIQKRTKADIIYLADKKNFPYGKKTKSQLYKIITDTIQKISERFNADVIVLASNTPSLLFREKLPDNVITVLPPLEKIQKASNVAILTTEIVAVPFASTVTLNCGRVVGEAEPVSVIVQVPAVIPVAVRFV